MALFWSTVTTQFILASPFIDLTHKAHVNKLKEKVNARNALLYQLSTSSWGANPTTIRSTALALCFSAAEYACAVWGCSAHAKKIGPVLNTSCRCITGCMKPTKTDDLSDFLSCIASPEVRRTAASQKELLGNRRMRDTPSMATLQHPNA